jgi:hypothetical protein
MAFSVVRRIITPFFLNGKIIEIWMGLIRAYSLTADIAPHFGYRGCDFGYFLISLHLPTPLAKKIEATEAASM